MEKIRDKNGKWLDTTVFRQEAIKFAKTKLYCKDPVGSPAYMDYWNEQLRRCREGFEYAGEKITGHHYFYLNFTQIKVVEANKISKTSKKVTKFPDFWDGDFDFFWCLEIAKNGVLNPDSLLLNAEEKERILALKPDKQYIERVKAVDRLKMKCKPHPDYLEGGNHMIVGKSRRKGYSYKNGAICANIYNSIRESLTILGAFDKKFLYPKGTMQMASDYLSFLNKHTAWRKSREFINRPDHKKASFKETIEGTVVEAGYQSEIIALTFGDNPDVARGKDALYVLYEEAGAFPNLKASYNATSPGLTAGKYITGQQIIFGTGGDMKHGTVDFADMFYNPEEYQLMPFINIWDDNSENSTCGFFHPIYMNFEGFYDEQGNSNIEEAIKYEKGVRERLLKKSSSSTTLQKRVQEYCLCPSEAFLTVSINDFPIVELRNRYNKVISEKLHLKYGQPCFLYKDTNEKNKVIAKPDLENQIEVLWDYKPKTKNLKGGVVIYEYPIESPPKGLYKIGFDPYRQASSSATSPSLASIYVYKARHKFSYNRDTIVAEYVGRPYDPDDVNRIAELLAELYNAEVMHENEVTHVKAYFQRRNKLNLLAMQPDEVISKNINDSKVARIYGIHMVDKLKDAGEKYIKKWLLEERDIDEQGNMLLNLDTICSPGLLEELIQYNRKGNFDRVMSFMMVMFQLEEDELEKEYGENEVNNNLKDLSELLSKLNNKH